MCCWFSPTCRSPRRRRARRLCHRRRALARLDGRLRDAVRHHAAQLDHDDLALRASRRRRGRAVGAADRHRRCRRPSGADPDDLDRDGARPAAARRRHERARARDRGADGARHRRRARDLDGAQPAGAADAGLAVRQVRDSDADASVAADDVGAPPPRPPSRSTQPPCARPAASGTAAGARGRCAAADDRIGRRS